MVSGSDAAPDLASLALITDEASESMCKNGLYAPTLLVTASVLMSSAHLPAHLSCFALLLPSDALANERLSRLNHDERREEA